MTTDLEWLAEVICVLPAYVTVVFTWAGGTFTARTRERPARSNHGRRVTNLETGMDMFVTVDNLEAWQVTGIEVETFCIPEKAT